MPWPARCFCRLALLSTGLYQQQYSPSRLLNVLLTALSPSLAPWLPCLGLPCRLRAVDFGPLHLSRPSANNPCKPIDAYPRMAFAHNCQGRQG